MVTNTQLVAAVIAGGVWCGGNIAAAAILALLNRKEPIMAAQKINPETVSLGSITSDVEEGVKILTDALDVAQKFEAVLPSGVDAAINAAVEALSFLQSVLSKV